MRSTFEKFGLIGSGVVVGVLISINFSVLAEMVSSPQLPIDDLRVFAEVFGDESFVTIEKIAKAIKDGQKLVPVLSVNVA